MDKEITGLFYKVFDRPYDPCTDPNDRIRIQKNTYLLDRLGLNLGEFLFLWDQYGPYSLELRNSVAAETGAIVEFSPDAIEQVKVVKNIIKRGTSLNMDDVPWLELICSLHYLKNYDCTPDGVIPELVKRKPHFKNDGINNIAMTIVDAIDDLGYYDGDTH